MKILGLGHSHIVAIAEGCYELQHQGATIAGARFCSRFIYLLDPAVTPTLLDSVDGQKINPRLEEIIAQEDADFGLLSIRGNEHIALSIAQRFEPIDFFLREENELPLAEGATQLTEAAIRETLRDKMAETIAILAALRGATRMPLYCLAPPPPLPDCQIMAYPKEFFKKAIDAERLSPEIFRYKIWRVACQLYREICAAQNIIFVEVPSAFIATPGLLAREAWGADATHANLIFGKAMVEKVIGMLEAQRESVAR
ncbi:hypothetical protein OGR47_02440 [Methylocystis sp. MJC1]|jgi:hypothetical protein|uniref:hypothetical protein n=1 Tax=Methylocystis sp. MJC1 TaxID=2654282 RepID=UPI0013ECD8BE|nr:hypothetical protein [Methylocystis sp. MJC1]KAF2989174.1 hypothetical protein MJC1_03756 [Methylocystis sp. MJC1]MBU6525872.1 hypothetical protein [Methylocystis sp. MJC1]UZX12339.1 hypothetical protein OGR47_02440 [Methylocystis sp. MJC1]